MNVLVQGAVHALGYYEDGKYYREPDCYETIRDLIRYLREDGEDHTARIECGRHNLVEHDLVPMVKCEDLSEEEFDIVIRLMVNLCQPAIATLRGKAPTDRDQWKMYWELEENLRKAKCAFTDPLFFGSIKKRIDNYFIETEYEDRDERLRLVVERIVLLIKYIFSINPDTSEGRRTRIEDSSHDRVIMALLESGIDKTLMHIANQPREKEFHVTILDIFALIFKEQTADDLAKNADDGISASEKKKTEEELRKIIENHTVKEAQKRRSFSRFGGSYVIQGMKGISTNSNQVVFKPIQNVAKHNFCDERKLKKRVARNRRPFEVDTNTHFSSTEVRQKLRDLVIRMTETCFNRLMKSAKSTVFVQGHVLQKTSQINYFFLVKFVLRFVRLARQDTLFDRISECTGVEAFHENNVQLTEYVENATTLKGVEAKSHGLKAQYALGAYNELILLHRYVFEHAKSEHEKKIARRALEHIVNVEEYRELPVSVIRKFSPAVLSNNFLRELVLTAHHYVRLVERFVKTGFLKKVTKKVKVRKQKKTKKALFEEDNRSEFDKMSQESLEKLWGEVKEDVEKILNKEVPEMEDMNPLNWKLEVEDNVQQQFAMLSIQRSLRSKGLAAAVGLYHASRKIWPTDAIFGHDGMTAEEELTELEQILTTDLKEVAKSLKGAEKEANKRLEVEENGEGEEEENEGEEEEEETPSWKVEEVDFEFETYVNKFANVDVLKWYVFLLNDFSHNSTDLNQALVKMLHRIAFDLKLVTRLYQVSLFQVFSKVNEHFSNLSNELRKSSPLFELYQFGYHVLKKFFVKFAELGEDLAIETLFWKGPKECFEIENGYGSWTKSKEADTRVWTEDLETEVRNLYDEYTTAESNDNIDVLDFIEHNLSRARTRKQIAKKLIEFGLDLLGAKWRNDKSQMDSVLPIGDIQKWYDEWKSAGQEGDVIEVLREKLVDSLGTEVSRKKIIKQLAHMGVSYEKPRKEKPLPVWDQGLIDELTKLKEQYEEIDDAENILGVDIVKYVMKRLSEKKPTRQVERYLISMGAKVVERPRKEHSKKTKSKKFDDEPGFVNDDSEEEPEKRNVSEEEKEDELEDMPRIKMATKRKAIVESDDDDENGIVVPEIENPEKSRETEKKEEPKKPVNTLMGLIANKKRKLAQLDSDSDSSSSSDSEDETTEKKNQKKKKNHLFSDDDDEDAAVYKRSYVDALLTSGSVAGVETRDTSEEPENPFTKPIKFKRRIVESDNEED